MISLTKIKTLRDVAVEQVERLKRKRHPDGWFIEDDIYWLWGSIANVVKNNIPLLRSTLTVLVLMPELLSI